MKNFYNLIGITVLFTVMVFSMTACNPEPGPEPEPESSNVIEVKYRFNDGEFIRAGGGQNGFVTVGMNTITISPDTENGDTNPVFTLSGVYTTVGGNIISTYTGTIIGIWGYLNDANGKIGIAESYDGFNAIALGKSYMESPAYSVIGYESLITSDMQDNPENGYGYKSY